MSQPIGRHGLPQIKALKRILGRNGSQVGMDTNNLGVSVEVSETNAVNAMKEMGIGGGPEAATWDVK